MISPTVTEFPAPIAIAEPLENRPVYSETVRPLLRLPGESAFANACLQDYAHMGHGRRIRRLWERYTKQIVSGDSTFCYCPTMNTLNAWSSRFHWKERVRAYDRAVELQEIEWRAELRRQRQAEIIEWEWEMSKRLIELGMAILCQPGAFLITRHRSIPAKRRKDGTVIPAREVTTVRLDTAALFRLLEFLSHLNRLNTGLPLRPGGDGHELRHLTDEQLCALLIRNAEKEAQRIAQEEKRLDSLALPDC